MTLTGLSHFDKTVHLTNEWLNELSKKIMVDNSQEVYLLFRAFLHAMRERLTIEESAHFSAQLPLLIKGIYFDGWKPSAIPLKIKTQEEFFALVEEKYSGEEEYKFEEITPFIISFLYEKVSRGEIEDMKSVLPEELKNLWRESEILK